MLLLFRCRNESLLEKVSTLPRSHGEVVAKIKLEVDEDQRGFSFCRWCTGTCLQDEGEEAEETRSKMKEKGGFLERDP